MIIVSGRARSGTSLMMRILYDSGFGVFSDEYGSFESEIIKDDLQALDVIDDNLTAAKVLAPLIKNLKPGHKVIWMIRNVTEQAKSHKKFLKGQGTIVPRAFIGVRAREIKATNRQMLVTLRKEHQVSVVNFDRLVTSPGYYQESLEKFVGKHLNMESIKIRNPKHSNLPRGTLELS